MSNKTAAVRVLTHLCPSFTTLHPQPLVVQTLFKDVINPRNKQYITGYAPFVTVLPSKLSFVHALMQQILLKEYYCSYNYRAIDDVIQPLSG